MRTNEIAVGQCYLAKVSGRVQTIRVDAVREVPVMRRDGSGLHYRGNYFNSTATRWDCTNIATGRKIVVRSPQRFRPIPAPPTPLSVEERAAALRWINAQQDATGIIVNVTAKDIEREAYRRRRMGVTV